ncbi:MAG: gamma-glutamylcyclotransferase family protein [Sulfitobacter sp.]
MHPYFFGYGSLVNRETHSYPDAERAGLRGWRRTWVRIAGHKTAVLTATPDPHTTIQGLIAAVPNADWAALDLRERAYARHPSGSAVLHDLSPPPQIAHYVVPEEVRLAQGPQVILLSYLDVVVQGYLREFGAQGVADFFATTDGWATTPIRNDRKAPAYPRHQSLSAQETALVDQHLALLSAQVQ